MVQLSFEGTIMPRADHILLEMLWIPSPFLSEPEIDRVFNIAHTPELLNKVPIVSVNPENLEPTQLKRDDAKVKQFAKEGNFHNALVLRREGVNYVVDGHHRVSASLLAKEPSIRVHLLDGESGEL